MSENGIDMSVLVVVNNSSDNTAQLAIEFLEDKKWGCVDVTPGKGKGLAVKHGWSYGTDLVAFSDADLAADIKALPSMVRHVLDGADMAVASRYCSRPFPKRSLYRSAASRMYRTASRLLLGNHVKDLQCGLKVADVESVRGSLNKCIETGWLLDSELIFHLGVSRKTVVEVPVSWVAGAESQLRFWSTSRQVTGFLWRLWRLNVRTKI
jgi:glycosyltransferase involved in cell wall biosynthesis